MTFNYVICTACDTVQLLTQDTPDFIPPSLWPPNSPDLNPVDYLLDHYLVSFCLLIFYVCRASFWGGRVSFSGVL